MNDPLKIIAERGLVPRIILNDHRLYVGDLKHYFKIVVTKARNLTKPYHNFRHMFYVVCTCFEACQYYLVKTEGHSRIKVRNLLIAGMFHDFDHSGVVGHDDLEIERALRGLKKHILPEDLAEYEAIAVLIRATEYPYKTHAKELSLEGQILRDADLSQALSEVWMQQILFGLSQEMNLTPLEMLRTQESFLANLKFNTVWAKERFNPEVVQSKIAEVRGLLEIME